MIVIEAGIGKLSLNNGIIRVFNFWFEEVSWYILGVY